MDDWGADIPEEVVMPKLKGTPEQKNELKELCKEFSQLFGAPPKGGCKLEPLSIDIDEKLLKQYQPDRARPVSPAVLEDIRFDIDLRTEKGWLRKGNGRFASAIVAAKQPGKPRRRICGDYRKINAMTQSIAYPCKNAKKTIEQLKGNKFYATCDMFKGYYQLKLDQKTSEMLAVITPDGLYEPVTAPFGPKQVPAAFQQRVSQEVLAGLEGNGIASYIDDLCTYAQDFETFISRLRELFERLDEFDLRLNGAKCVLGGSEIDFLGMHVTEKGVEHTEKRKAAIKGLAAPKTKKQLKSFLGMAGYFRSHIPNFARRAKPLTLLTKKCSPDKLTHVWSAEQE